MNQMPVFCDRAGQAQDLDVILLRYEQLPNEIEALERLTDERKQLLQSVESLLTIATEPARAASLATPSLLGLGFEFRGSFIGCAYQIDAYAGALRAIFEYLPTEQRPRVVEVMNRMSPKHLELAESPEALFPDQHGQIKAGQWKRVTGELVCYAILDSTAKRKRLKRACRIAGLKYGTDVRFVGF